MEYDELDDSEGARIFKALLEANLPPLGRISIVPEDDAHKKPIPYRHLPYKVRRTRPQSQPYTEIQSIMETPPHGVIEESVAESEERQEALIAAVSEVWKGLTETERWIYHMLVDVGLSMRLVALALGTPKTTFARRRDALAEKLKNELLRHEAVIEHLAKGRRPPSGSSSQDTDPETT